MKLTKIHLFFILLLILLFSNLGFVIREGVDFDHNKYKLLCSPAPMSTPLSAPVTFDNEVVQAIGGIIAAAVVGTIIYYLI